MEREIDWARRIPRALTLRDKQPVKAGVHVNRSEI